MHLYKCIFANSSVYYACSTPHPGGCIIPTMAPHPVLIWMDERWMLYKKGSVLDCKEVMSWVYNGESKLERASALEILVRTGFTIKQLELYLCKFIVAPALAENI